MLLTIPCVQYVICVLRDYGVVVSFFGYRSVYGCFFIADS